MRISVFSVRVAFSLCLAQALALLCVMPLCAQQLPLRRYDISDGLAHGEVTSIYQDAKGYLWFTTFEGLSRFDGYRFTNYGARDGLPHTIINHVTEDRQGRLWVATNGGGVARLIDDPRQSSSPPRPDAAPRTKFISLLIGDHPVSNKVNRMLFDSQDNLWCLTDFGLYRAGVTDTPPQFVPVIARESSDSDALLEDRRGRLWFGMANELIEVKQGRVIHHGPVGGAGRERITGIIADRDDRLLVASPHGLFEYLPPGDTGERGGWRQLPLALKPHQFILAMLEDRAGNLWLGATTALLKYRDGRQTEYKTAQGLSVANVRSLAEDRDGNLWVGTVGGGAHKLAGEAIVSYTSAAGLPHPVVARVFEDHRGRIKAVLSVANSDVVEIAGDKLILNQKFDRLPTGSYPFFFRLDSAWRSWRLWMTGALPVSFHFPQPLLQLRNGREINVAALVPRAAWATGFFAYEDEAGRLWVSQGDGKLHCTDPTRPGQPVFESFAAGPPPIDLSRMLVMSDGAGGLWLGNLERLGRLWQGKFTQLQPTDGLPETDPRCFFKDSRGWLWIGMRYTGVSVTTGPGAEQPSFINYSTAQGLSSNAVWSITEDDSGRMYFGTGKGLDQFDPNTNQWRRFTSREGLPSDKINHLYKDRNGDIWVSTMLGVAKFNPRAERAASPPAPIYFSRVNVAGEDLPMPETGAATLPPLEFAAARNNLLIEFVALSFQGEDNLQYQYQLEGVDSDWGAPARSRSVNYARLAPGAYRFLVRAINPEGVPSPAPAMLEFRILPPVYLRWWFLSLAALGVGLLAYTLYRYRVKRLLELERVRLAIAADLHDDIGANLSKIAILSEVARWQADGDVSDLQEPLSSIATISRESVAAMSDIVWAINPSNDSLTDLTRRMRQFAEEIFLTRNIEFDFRAPPADADLKLGADARRTVYLVFKEAVNNLVRHSGCRRAAIALGVEGGWLVLRVSDDGCGFDAEREGDGNGLISMRKRVAASGGKLEIISGMALGTTLTLRLPVNPAKTISSTRR